MMSVFTNLPIFILLHRLPLVYRAILIMFLLINDYIPQLGPSKRFFTSDAHYAHLVLPCLATALGNYILKVPRSITDLIKLGPVGLTIIRSVITLLRISIRVHVSNISVIKA